MDAQKQAGGNPSQAGNRTGVVRPQPRFSGEARSRDFRPKGCLDGWAEGAKTRKPMSRARLIHYVRQGS
jgi:hypothetical protein